MLSRWVVTCLLAALLSGCAAYHFPSKVPAQLEDLRSQISPGKTSREEVQRRLGAALISAETVEVYRVLHGHDVVLGGPVIPVMWDTEEVIIYALVTYGEHNLVEDIDWSVYQQDRKSFGGNRKDTMDVFRSARLQSGAFSFVAFNEIGFLGSSRKELLLAPPSLTQSALDTPPPAGMCPVFIFLEEVKDGRGLPRTLYLDGEELLEMPLIPSVYWRWASKGYWDSYYLNVFAKILVPEGEHRLRITTSLRPPEFRSKFACKPGRVFYAQPRLKLVTSEPWGMWGKTLKYEGAIAISHETEKNYAGWKRLLFYKGTWLGED